MEKVKLEGIGLVKRIIRRATETEIRTYQELHEQKNIVVFMMCDNPYCDELIRTSRKQKIKLNTEDPLKGNLEFLYCSKGCREQHYKALTEKG